MSAKILEIENLTVSFDGFKALNQLNFSMNAGELRVVIGPNGAGKTTFLDVITGKVQPTSGVARFKGKNLRALSEEQIARLGIGRKFQTPRIYLKLTVRENLDLSCNRHKNIWSTLLGQPSTAEKQTIAGLLEIIGLATKANLPAELLSHGEKQRLEIGMLVAQSPDLLLVDEPVAGLTDEETENVGNLLITLAEDHSIIVIEHDMEFVRQIARQVTVLHEGTVLCEGSMEQVQNDPKVIEVYLGKAPTISADQMLMLRIAATMAWADGNFEAEELDIIVTRLSHQFTDNPEHRIELQDELRNYVSRKTPLETLVPVLETVADQEQALALSYEVICANDINQQEAAYYQQLLDLLDLPSETVQRIETDVRTQLNP